MKQILHIFKKDTRHFWPEILTSIAITAAFALVYPLRWHFLLGGAGDARAREIMTLGSFLFLLVPATWWLLIARVIHDEALVGESQFWLTRPYERGKLLSAKLLFCVVWIYLPLIAGQALVVVQAGLSPWSNPSGWLVLLLLDSGIAIVPLIALATVTSNFARMTLWLLGVVLFVSASVTLSEMRTGYEATVPYPHRMAGPLVVLVLGAIAIAMQYAARRVWLSRGLLVVALALAAAIPFTLYASRETVIDRDYAAGGSPVQLAPGVDTRYPLKLEWPERPGMVYIHLPVQFSGVADGHAVQVDNVKFSVDAPDGSHWTAPWWTAQQWTYLPGTHLSGVQLMMPRDLYERYKSVPLTLHLVLAVTDLQAGEPVSATISRPDFVVSHLGVCSVVQFELLNCRSALGEPQLTQITTTWSSEPCSDWQPDGKPAAYSTAWAGTAYRDPLGSGPIAVQMDFANLPPIGADGSYLEHHEGMALCPGTPVNFTQYNVVGRSRAELTIPDFHLPPDTFR
jgi:hypothetical protein